MVTLRLTVRLPTQLHEILIAELATSGFEAFEQDGVALKAYGPRTSDTVRATRDIPGWLVDHGTSAPIDVVEIPAVNWNEQWERSVQPVLAGRFQVVPSWHVDDVACPAGFTRIVIDPKMSFGTGHHPSTRLALGLLTDEIRAGQRVLDAGSGTGVLSIAAALSGARSVVGFDTDQWAYENAVENVRRNGVADRVQIRAGGIDTVPETVFDVVVANIVRNVIVGMLPELVRKTGGSLILAGLLLEDRDEILGVTSGYGLQLNREAAEGEWWAVALSFRPSASR